MNALTSCYDATIDARESRSRLRHHLIIAIGDPNVSHPPPPLDADQLRWICDPDTLQFKTTESLPHAADIIGQPLAREALEFALDCHAKGQNVYVRGISGTGRLTMVRQLLSQMAPKNRRPLDHCYVQNFTQPDRPRLLSLPLGKGAALDRKLQQLAEYVTGKLGDAMNQPLLQAARTAIHSGADKQIKALSDPFEKTLEVDELTLVQMQTPQGMQSAIVPRIEGQPVPLEQLGNLISNGQLTEADRDSLISRIEQHASQLPELSRQMGLKAREATEHIDTYNRTQLKRLLTDYIEPIRQIFPGHAPLETHLLALIEDVIEQVLVVSDENYDPFSRYAVNVLVKQSELEAPVVIESSPTLANLLGTIETQWQSNGQSSSDFRGVRAGSLLQADGGYLILEADDLMAEPGSWKMLIRTLRSGLLEIVPAEFRAPFAPVSLKPEPIPVEIRVVLLGSHGLYNLLDQNDPDFDQQFKVLADFDSAMPRTTETVNQYGGVIASIAHREGLRHFTADAVAALAEHGARIADSNAQLSTRFGRIADLVREANWVAGKQAVDLVTGEHIRQTVARTKHRASLPSHRFQQVMQDGTIHIECSGHTVGQINALAVISAGPLKYGFPSRITASISAGQAGLISIEDRASMSGSIHKKGFHILGGLIRHLLRADHPLAFTASLAFEQSYGGIDGDSASGAETCCLISALTGVPIRQDLAMTGAIDQHGRIEAVGGVNEKIEGFFDICNHFGLTGTQGVIIPASNIGDLMLRHDVVDAAREGRFEVIAVGHICDALAALTGMSIGTPGSTENPPDSLLGMARQRVRDYWEETVRGPRFVDLDPAEGQSGTLSLSTPTSPASDFPLAKDSEHDND